MKKIIIMMLMVASTISASQPVCNANEYAKKVCQVVYMNGQKSEMCMWTCIPLSGAGR